MKHRTDICIPSVLCITVYIKLCSSVLTTPVFWIGILLGNYKVFNVSEFKNLLVTVGGKNSEFHQS
jgi:hypothetical protein